MGSESRYLLDLLAGVSRAAARVAAHGRRPVLLHVGAADLANPARFADLDLYTRATALLREEAARQSLQLVLVEPNVAFHPRLAENARKLPLHSSQVKLVSGMVADACHGNSSRMYRFSVQVEEDFGIPFSVYGTWFSGDRHFPMDALRVFAAQPPHWPMSEDDMRRFRLFSGVPNASDYVEEVRVPCYTPSSLLASLGLQARDLAMVVVDAERYDARIVRALAALPNFRPGYLQWEGSLDTAGQQQLAAEVRALGFKVGDVRGGGRHSDAENIVAVPVQPGEA